VASIHRAPQFVLWPHLRANPLGDLITRRRTGSISEYYEQFLTLLARARPLTEPQQVQLFTVGLQPPMSIYVQIQAPNSLELAMNLAHSFEPQEQVVAALPPPSSSVLPEIIPSMSMPLPLSLPCPSCSSAQDALSSIPQPLKLPPPPSQFTPSSSTVSAVVPSTPATTLVGKHTVHRLSTVV
jgi:hypothetical protein